MLCLIQFKYTKATIQKVPRVNYNIFVTFTNTIRHQIIDNTTSSEVSVMNSAIEPMLFFKEGQELFYHPFVIITIKN